MARSMIEWLRELGEETETEAWGIREATLLAAFLRAQDERDTERLDLQRRNWSNGILLGGSRPLNANLQVILRFQVPYAWLWVSDPLSQGPLWIANTDDPSLGEETGPGRWVVAAGGAEPVPLYGDGLTITAPSGVAGKAICVTAFARPFTGTT